MPSVLRFPRGRSTALNAFLAACHIEIVQRQIEFEDVDSRLAEEAEDTTIGVTFDEVEHLVELESTFVGDPSGLDPGVGHRDVRVKTARRPRDGVDGHLGMTTDATFGKKQWTGRVAPLIDVDLFAGALVPYGDTLYRASKRNDAGKHPPLASLSFGLTPTKSGCSRSSFSAGHQRRIDVANAARWLSSKR